MKCSDQILIELLKDTEIATEKEATVHIESCTHCQRRIAELAADDDSWNDVAVAFEDETGTSVVIAIDTELAEDMPLQADPISLDFLDPPQHPEMLGRVGRYDVERLIGMGGMGIVLKAFDTELHRPVAVKVLAPHLAHSGAARQRFAREAQSAAAVVHENVVPIHNVDAAGKLPFLVMQYVSGESLQSRVDRDGPLTIDEVLRIGAQIAHGLSAAHEQGLVHRDVKPGNVLMEESIDRVLISDFGLARAADDASVTRSGVIAGTPHYMSPEQARGDAVDARSDLFGLGSVLYFMCTGRPPFRADGAIATLNRICHDPHRPVDMVNERVPTGLAALIDELLAKQPNKRPNTSLDVASRLTRELHDKRSRNRFRRRTSGRRLWIGAVLTTAVLVSAVARLANRPDSRSQIDNAPTQFTNAYPIDSPAAQRFVADPSPHRNPTYDPVNDRLDQAFARAPAPPKAFPTQNQFAEPVLEKPSPTPTVSSELFRDQQFYNEISELDQLTDRLEEPKLRDTPMTITDTTWQEELSTAAAIATALESGANEISAPYSRLSSEPTKETKREEE